MTLSTIGMLWMEGPLSYLEQLCVKSFVDAGHRVVLYHYGPLENVPAGVELDDAEQFLPREGFLTHKRTGSPALHSDVFRYKMLKANRNMIWADTDAYCMRPFETPNGHFYGWESKSHINGGVLGLPHDSATLDALLAFTSDEFAIPSYYGPDYEQELIAAKAAGNPVHASEQPWGVWGPHAVTHFLHETGEAKYALPQEGLYPFLFKDRRKMLKANFDTTGYITDNTYSVHFYGRRMRKRLVEREGGIPHPKSLIGQLLAKHNVDPAKAPLPVAAPAPEAAASEAPAADQTAVEAPVEAPATAPQRAPLKGQVNLTDIADKYTSDKGSAKHRYSELYQMLLLPYRNRAVNLLELGLQSSDADQTALATRKTDDAPSVKMWLEYFPKGKVHGLDVADFSWLTDDRFTFVQCDLAARDNIAAAAASLPMMDIIVDDASHVSHHQQFAFLELWDKLKSGGLYVIENMRRQPSELERDDITKTGDLFYNFQVEKTFQHSDPQIEAELNAIAPEISGCFVFQAGYNRKKRHQMAVLHKR